jgi:hypothetical protein
MTHINAYHQDVQEKQQAVDEAKAELEASQTALKEHPDYKAPKKAEKKVEVKEESKSEKVEVKRDSSRKKK